MSVSIARFAPEHAEEVEFRAILGLAVLLVGIGCANVTSLPIDVTPFAARLGDETIRELFTAGFVLQLLTATVLTLALLLDVRFMMRPALLGWFAAMGLYLAPVPTLLQGQGAIALPLSLVMLVSLIGWALDSSIRTNP